MKNSLLLLLLSVSLIINAQNYQRRLFRPATTGNVESVVYSNEYNTTTFLIRNIYNGSPYTASVDLTKFTTTTGNVTSSKTFSVAGYDLAVYDVVKNNQMLYMVGALSNSAGATPCVIKYNLSTNATVWRKTLSTINNVYRGITYDNAKNIYYLGSYFNAAQSKTDLMLAKMDTNGVLSWTKNIGETTFNQNQNSCGIVYNGNRALYITNCTPNGIANSTILRLDTAGTVLAAKSITVGAYPKFYQNFVTILNGQLVSIDRTISNSSSDEGPVLFRKLDTNLVANVTKVLGPDMIINDVFSNSSNLLISGIVPIGGGFHGFRTIRFDTVLTISGSRHYSKIITPTGSNAGRSCSFINSSNNSFHFFNPYFYDTVYVAKTDIFDGVGCQDSTYHATVATLNYSSASPNYTNSILTNSATTVTVPVATVTYSSSSVCTAITTGIAAITGTGFLSVFPNPVSSVLTVTLEDNTASQFVIRDITGKELMADAFNDKINVSHLQAGIYFISVYDDNKQLTRVKKFIKN